MAPRNKTLTKGVDGGGGSNPPSCSSSSKYFCHVSGMPPSVLGNNAMPHHRTGNDRHDIHTHFFLKREHEKNKKGKRKKKEEETIKNNTTTYKHSKGQNNEGK